MPAVDPEHQLFCNSGLFQLLEPRNCCGFSLAKFGVEAPESYKLYLRLGRFRNALVLDEEKRRPTDGLRQMIDTYRLNGYVPKETVGELRPSGTEL